MGQDQDRVQGGAREAPEGTHHGLPDRPRPRGKTAGLVYIFSLHVKWLSFCLGGVRRGTAFCVRAIRGVFLFIVFVPLGVCRLVFP